LKEDEYEVTNDGRGTRTCNLTIESVSESSAGVYTSYTADDQSIQECVVKVTGQGSIGPVFGIVLVILLVAGIAILVTILVHQEHIKLEHDGKLIFEWKGHNGCSIQLKKGVRERVQSMEEGTGTDGEGPTQ